MPDSLSWQTIIAQAYGDLKEFGGDIVQAVKDAAPLAWEIAQRQVYVEAITDTILSFLITLFLAGMAYGVYRAGVKQQEIFNAPRISKDFNGRETVTVSGTRWAWDDEGFPFALTGTISAIGSSISLVSFAILATHLVRVCVNPDYYTIKLIAQLAGM